LSSASTNKNYTQNSVAKPCIYYIGLPAPEEEGEGEEEEEKKKEKKKKKKL
jgi:hypothetical protein